MPLQYSCFDWNLPDIIWAPSTGVKRACASEWGLHSLMASCPFGTGCLGTEGQRDSLLPFQTRGQRDRGTEGQPAAGGKAQWAEAFE